MFWKNPRCHRGGREDEGEVKLRLRIFREREKDNNLPGSNIS